MLKTTGTLSSFDTVANVIIIGSRALSFGGPLLSLSVEFCLCVCLFVRNFEVKYLENQSR